MKFCSCGLLLTIKGVLEHLLPQILVDLLLTVEPGSVRLREK